MKEKRFRQVGLEVPCAFMGVGIKGTLKHIFFRNSPCFGRLEGGLNLFCAGGGRIRGVEDEATEAQHKSSLNSDAELGFRGLPPQP